MNSKPTIIALVAAMAVLSGALGMSLTGTFSDQKIGVTNVATGMMTGHLEIEARNADGEVIAYRQTDNEVVDDGEQCILKMLFATTNDAAGRGNYASTGSGACTGILTAAWNVIAIGDCNAGNEGGDCTALFAEGNTPAEDDLLVRLGNETATVNGLQRGMATSIDWTNGTGGTTTKIVLAKTFTMGGASSLTHAIGESGLFNSTTAGAQGMLARQTFTDVSLSNGDSITVTWTFTVGN